MHCVQESQNRVSSSRDIPLEILPAKESSNEKMYNVNDAIGLQDTPKQHTVMFVRDANGLDVHRPTNSTIPIPQSY
jgi:hypothetical protein